MLSKAERLAIEDARAVVGLEIAHLANGGGRFASGLAGEGYAGGYRDALSDVLLLLVSKTKPNTRHYWHATP